MPHHSQRNPERHSAEKQLFLHTAHLELFGRLPSRQWWVCLTADRSFPGTYVAFSLQSATAKSWHSICTKYSHTANKNKNESCFTNSHVLLKFFTISFIYTIQNNFINCHILLSQCTDNVSSNRFRQTLQNFFLRFSFACSDQQCATGFYNNYYVQDNV